MEKSTPENRHAFSQVTLRGNEYRAVFEGRRMNSEEDNSQDYAHWPIIPSTWWEGYVKINNFNKNDRSESRATFETYHKINAAGGGNENLEDCLLLVKGRNNDTNLIHHYRLNKVSIDLSAEPFNKKRRDMRRKAIDYLLERIWNKTLLLSGHIPPCKNSVIRKKTI